MDVVAVFTLDDSSTRRQAVSIRPYTKVLQDEDGNDYEKVIDPSENNDTIRAFLVEYGAALERGIAQEKSLDPALAGQRITP